MNHNTLYLKRLIKDIEELNKNNLHKHNIYHQTYDDQLNHLKILIIGTNNTPYEYGYYFFDINIPDDYPFSPPKVIYKTQNNKTRFNPNLYINGKVCLSIINTWSGPKWTSCNNIMSVLLAIQAFVFVQNPLHNEPGFENDNSEKNTNYNIIISYQNINTAIINMLSNIPSGFECFKDIMIQKFINNYHNIINNINNLHKYNNKLITMNTYNMKDIINCDLLEKNLNSLYNNFKK